MDMSARARQHPFLLFVMLAVLGVSSKVISADHVQRERLALSVDLEICLNA